MSAKVRVWVIIAAVIVLGYPAAAWVIGISTEKQIEAREQQALQAVPYVTIVKRTYSRGVYGATEEVTYGLSSTLAKALQAAPADGFLRDARLTVRNTVHHGPLPGMRTFAMATIDTELVLPAEMRKRLDGVLHGKPIVSARSTLRWGGSTHYEMTSPEFEVEVSPGETLVWRGLTGSGEATRDQQSMRGEFTFKGVELRSAKGSGELGQIHGTADLRKAFGTLQVGKVGMTLDKAAVRPADPSAAISFEQMRVEIDSALTGDYIDSRFDVAIAKLNGAHFEATQVGYQGGIEHEYGPAMAAFAAKMQEVSRHNLESGEALQASSQNVLDVMKHEGVDVLLHDPVLEFSRIGFVTPEGELRIAAKVAAPGLRKEDFSKEGPALMAAVMPHIQASADLSIDITLLQKLTAGNPRGEQFQTQLQAFEKQGYVVSTDKTLTTHLAFNAGRLTVNNMPFPPPPSAQPPVERAAPPPPSRRRKGG